MIPYTGIVKPDIIKVFEKFFFKEIFPKLVKSREY